MTNILKELNKYNTKIGRRTVKAPENKSDYPTRKRKNIEEDSTQASINPDQHPSKRKKTERQSSLSSFQQDIEIAPQPSTSRARKFKTNYGEEIDNAIDNAVREILFAPLLIYDEITRTNEIFYFHLIDNSIVRGDIDFLIAVTSNMQKVNDENRSDILDKTNRYLEFIRRDNSEPKK